MSARAVFLDRDGVVNVDHGYVGRWQDFEFAPGAVDAMRRLQEAGWLLVVVTNQSGIARGYYTEADYQALTARMKAELAAAGAPLAGVYHCPHHPQGSVAAYAQDCDCRKPAPGLILRAAAELGLTLADSVLVGDKASDAQAARAAGVGRVVLVAETADAEGAAIADAVAPSLAAAVQSGLLQPSRVIPAAVRAST
ncbi:D-glycero-beta-D-manno-heptose-1,7-bisphosphate 7-phosphatase [Rubrivivax gelatinosus]|uniref:D,D-heptose 1,7-bisphosphate phosphatase n=1 Tax=Rubrivivax gelatinosus TaxID=28068 RepID=A0ABS1DV94_RUBGE|nr:D-glycero-beta-D-manno-heptose-1,7-bisphosphate 7-phosphatase [Rubrivivax gelatinosus]MBK1713947.1 D-glycero-beta-D-manno-heptose-1,7-bisphosphate 7-phosphatase [Rubrivivax gelatinosus]